MQQKDIIALTVLPVALAVTTTILCMSRRARAIAFFLLAAGLVLATRLDVNFLSHEWYRGTTRGIEVSFVDLLSFGLVFSSIFFPVTKTHITRIQKIYSIKRYINMHY